MINYVLICMWFGHRFNQSFREEILETLLSLLVLSFLSIFGMYIFSSCLSFSFCIDFLKITDLKSLMSLDERFIVLFMLALYV